MLRATSSRWAPEHDQVGTSDAYRMPPSNTSRSSWACTGQSLDISGRQGCQGGVHEQKCSTLILWKRAKRVLAMMMVALVELEATLSAGRDFRSLDRHCSRKHFSSYAKRPSSCVMITGNFTHLQNSLQQDCQVRRKSVLLDQGRKQGGIH